MSSYHNSFTYLEKNSADEGFIIASFEPDNGFKDTFLGMDQVSEDYYDGTKTFLYGTKYNTKATISITLVKADDSDFTIEDNRNALQWLTGSRVASWLDLCTHKEQNEKGELVWKPIYSFLGTVTATQQYKVDGRVIGLSFEFTSLSPWAYSVPQEFNRSIAQALHITEDGVLYADNEMSITPDGTLSNGYPADEGADSVGANFGIMKDGTLYVENLISAILPNKTDDLYSYIYLDIEYTNETCKWVTIKRVLLSTDEYLSMKEAGQAVEDKDCEITRVTNLSDGEVVHITGKQFIISYTRDQITEELVVNENRPIFGDDFNFIWPKLVPGDNIFIIEGDGDGFVKFTYRYPMKVGDCAMDISTYGGGTGCCDSNNIASYNTVRWEDITGAPTSLSGYGITDAYTKDEVYAKSQVYAKTDTYSKAEIDNRVNSSEVEWDDINNTPTTVAGYGIIDVYSKDETYTKIEVDDKIDDIEISGGTGSGSITIDEEKLNSMLEDILG